MVGRIKNQNWKNSLFPGATSSIVGQQFHRGAPHIIKQIDRAFQLPGYLAVPLILSPAVQVRQFHPGSQKGVSSPAGLNIQLQTGSTHHATPCCAHSWATSGRKTTIAPAGCHPACHRDCTIRPATVTAPELLLLPAPAHQQPSPSSAQHSAC